VPSDEAIARLFPGPIAGPFRSRVGRADREIFCPHGAGFRRPFLREKNLQLGVVKSMNKVCRLVAACAVLAVCGSAFVAGPVRAADDGWISLFDGKTLTGWKATERPENWTVEDGAICGQGDRSHLFYADREFKNFEFKADVMINEGGNSGIFFHSQPEEGWPTKGYESQVNNTHKDPVKTGSIYYTVKVFESAAKDNTWWTQHIIVQGNRITVKINDKTLFEYDEPEGVTGPHKLSQGKFALQQHDPGSKVRYKNILVKPLP
jgi:hypothetical protein